MKVLTATTGREAIALVETTPGLAIVLMDIMMPEMDGYETIQLIRQNPGLRRLPIVALTAKAMKGDREKCLEAGASDYLAKPVNTEQLLSALRTCTTWARVSNVMMQSPIPGYNSQKNEDSLRLTQFKLRRTDYRSLRSKKRICVRRIGRPPTRGRTQLI